MRDAELRDVELGCVGLIVRDAFHRLPLMPPHEALAPDEAWGD